MERGNNQEVCAKRQLGIQIVVGEGTGWWQQKQLPQGLQRIRSVNLELQTRGQCKLQVQLKVTHLRRQLRTG